MFFVGPGNSPIIVFKQFSEWFGWYVNTPIYIFAVCLGAYLLFVLIYWLHNKELPSRRKDCDQTYEKQESASDNRRTFTFEAFMNIGSAILTFRVTSCIYKWRYKL